MRPLQAIILLPLLAAIPVLVLAAMMRRCA